MRGGPVSAYRDQHFKGSRSEQERLLRLATTMYVGNMSFFTTEEQIYELFSKAGEVKRIVMGLDRFRKTPCGFCFVEYYTRMDAENCMKYVNGTRLDDRVVRTDWDAGFQEGRQYGRGKTGGQVRDEYRTDYDPGRGGFGKIVAQRVSVIPGADETAVKVEEDAAPAAKRRKTGHDEVQETGDVEDAADVGGEVADETMNEEGVEVDVKDIPKDPPNPLNRT